MTAFLELGLAEPITRALVEERYETPTPIQAQTIPQVLAGRDVVGIAQTGTGKTAAFALPILNHLAKNRHRPERKSCCVLVLSPTRELSGQIRDSFRTYGRHMKVSVTLAIGGVPIGKQIRALANGVDVLVATPGRLLDLMQERAVTLEKVEILVLDEADRMLDMGFIHDIRRIVGKCPVERQTLFFSATMPPPIEELGRLMLRDPARVAVTPQASTVERIAQRVVHVDKSGKASLLADLLKSEPIDRAIVFTRTKHGADRVVRQLSQQGLTAEAIHGNKSQGQRERALAAFRNGKVRTLIATDIAARGIDVDGITHVFNYDLPNVAESYVHRIGRTARAGADGIAISFCDKEERAYLRDIEKLIRMALPATDGRTGQPVEARPPSPARAPGQPSKGKPRNRPGQRGRRRDQEAKAGNAGQGGHQRDSSAHAPRAAAQPFTAQPRRNGGTADGELSSVGFMRDRRHERRTKRPHAQSPR
ncbi:MAG: DEAD/DEAH box helicase [Pseudorhodoplanes sp.]|uniref:DEAD/DEAH box helicase n=1 Tax=Pseudorhodoplanes sp. TaxID=1934341 RepID=UPI003D0B4ED5